MLRPNKNIQKVLISTPSHFVSEYESDTFLMTHAWPFQDEIKLALQLKQNPYSRYYLVAAIKTEPIKVGPDNVEELFDYSFLGDKICVYLSILFGKRFDNHGAIESSGFFSLPNIENQRPILYTFIGPNNNSPRKDLGIQLNLKKIALIEKLFINNSLKEKFLNTLNTAGKFYLRSLQMFEYDPEIAFLDLVNCGEVLSNYYKYAEEELFDKKLKNLLSAVKEGIETGESIYNELKGRLLQIKRKYTLTITGLLNDYFFTNTESKNEFFGLRKAGIEKRIKASYDLRSLYLHKGIRLWPLLRPNANYLNEIQLGSPVAHPGAKKIFKLSPTYIGLERIMRFCLLRFIHLNAFSIDERLNNDRTGNK